MSDIIEDKMEETLVKVKPAKKKRPEGIKVVGVDTPIEDVLKWIQEERELRFEEGDNFLELDTEVVTALSRTNRMRYDVAKAITIGDDVVQTVEDGARGWSRDYAITPGSASSRTFVKGKDPNKDYYLSRVDSVDYHIGTEGFKVTRDPNISVGGRQETCTYKSVGGQRETELVLLERDKKIADKIQRKKKHDRDALTKSTRENYAEKADRNGFDYDRTMDDLSGKK